QVCPVCAASSLRYVVKWNAYASSITMICGRGLSAISASIARCACAADESLTWIFQSATTVSTKDEVGGGGGGGVPPAVVKNQTGPGVDPAAFFAMTCQ